MEKRENIFCCCTREHREKKKKRGGSRGKKKEGGCASAELFWTTRYRSREGKETVMKEGKSSHAGLTILFEA